MTTIIPFAGLHGTDRTKGGEAACSVFEIEAARVLRLDDLHAYVDAALNSAERASFEAQLARDPQAYRRAAAYRTLNIDLHRLFDGDLPSPPEPLAALSRELERRIKQPPSGLLWKRRQRTSASAGEPKGYRGSSMRRVGFEFGNPFRRFAKSDPLGRIAAAIDQAPIASMVIVACLIVVAGLALPILGGRQTSCNDRVDAMAKSVAQDGSRPELARELATAGFLCGTGETARAHELLARLGEDLGQPLR